MKIERVVIPAAGLGTRFLPITKAIPKEMLPIWNKPAIHYIIKEVFLSDIKNVSLILSKDKNAIIDYFDYSYFLDEHLKSKGLSATISELDFIIQDLTFNFLRQSKPKGLGDAILHSKSFVKEDHFAVALPDDIVFAKNPLLLQLYSVFKKYSLPVLAVQEVPLEQASSYGVIKIKEKLKDNLFEIEDVIEKPQSNPPSNLAVIGRYILPYKVFDFIENSKPDKKNEIQLTTPMADMIKSGYKMLALKFEGERFDIGSPKGLLEANKKVYQNFKLC